MERSELIRDVIQAAMEFHQRKLWRHFTNFDCFVVRLAGIEDPFLASVMGDAGEQYGLMLFRGPHAAESFAALTVGDGPGDDAAEAMDMLAFSMDTFGEMAPECQAFFRKARIHPRYDEPVPNLLVKPPNRNVRLPNEDELEVLLTVLKAVVLADRKMLLKPAQLDDEGGICVVTPDGDPATLTVAVTREKLSQRATLARRPVFAASGLDLSGLKLLNATWLVGTPVMPGGIRDDDRSMQILLVADDASGLVLQAYSFFSEQIQDAVHALADAFHGRQSSGLKGLPHTVVFSNRSLHDAMTSALQKAGVKCIYMATIPKLQEIAADLLNLMGQDMPSLNEFLAEDQEDEAAPAPDDLAGWKEADNRLAKRFADHLFNGERLHSSRAIKRYFGRDDIDHFFKKHENRGVVMAFSAWGMLDYRPTKTSKTQAEKMLAQGLPGVQAMLLRARMEAHPTVHRVAGHNPKAGTVDLEDVLLGGTVTVYDRLLSENIDNNLFLVARAFPAGRFHFIEVAGPPLGTGMVTDAVEFLRDCGLEFTREGLKCEAHKFGWLWGWTDEWEANWQPPRLCNTDGDEMLFHTASFTVADPAAVRQALLRRKDIDHDEDEDEFIWSKATGQGAKMLGGPVTLGRIEFVGDELVLTVNSAKRFETARRWLTRLPGVTFLDVTTESVEPGGDRPPDERISEPQPVEITPDMVKSLQEMLDRRYMEWIDTRLPALGGRTPRQACRTPAGRERVKTLIRTIPDPMDQAPVRVPRQAMLRELGLAFESQAPHPAAPLPPRTPPDPDVAEPAALPPRDMVGRNGPCPCGSGKKYKKCCGR